MPFLMALKLSEKASITKQWYPPTLRGDQLWEDTATRENSLVSGPAELWVNWSSKLRIGNLPDVIGWYRRFLVSERTKYAIEAIEPGVHLFREMPVRWALRKNLESNDFTPGDLTSERYYILIVKSSVDCLIEEDSTLHKTARSQLDGGDVFVQIDAFGHHTLDRKAINGLHLWKSKVGAGTVSIDYCYCSDAFRKAIADLKIDGWSFKRVRLSVRHN